MATVSRKQPHPIRRRRRIRRRAWAGVAVAAVLAGVWVGSAWILVQVVPPRYAHMIHLRGGEITVHLDGRAVIPHRPWEFLVHASREPISNHFGWFERVRIAGTSSGVLYIPLWPFILASGVPSAWVLDAMRRRRRGRGMCAACGYDLAGLKAGVCPECGKAKA